MQSGGSQGRATHKNFHYVVNEEKVLELLRVCSGRVESVGPRHLNVYKDCHRKRADLQASVSLLMPTESFSRKQSYQTKKHAPVISLRPSSVLVSIEEADGRRECG